MFAMFQSRSLFYTVLVILGMSVICHSAKEYTEKKLITEAENEGSSVDNVRDRRDIRKSNEKMGMFSPMICEKLRRSKIRNAPNTKSYTSFTRRLGFFTEIYCRIFLPWLNPGKDGNGHKFRDCQDIQKRKGKGWSKSGVFTIHPKGWKPIKVYCDMKTVGGGWTVFQHRFDGSVNFYRTWSEYKSGFGSLHGEFWLGNENIHRLSSKGKYKLRIILEDFSGHRRYVEYKNFALSDEKDKYKLSIGSYKGPAGYNALSYHNKMKFTTKDVDNDLMTGSNCASSYKGGWWYKRCINSNLNGLYHNGKARALKYNMWFKRYAFGYSNMKSTTMMIRKV